MDQIHEVVHHPGEGSLFEDLRMIGITIFVIIYLYIYLVGLYCEPTYTEHQRFG